MPSASQALSSKTARLMRIQMLRESTCIHHLENVAVMNNHILAEDLSYKSTEKYLIPQ